MTFPHAYDDEPDLDYGNDGLSESHEVKAPLAERTTCLPPGSGRVDWAEVKRALTEHKASKGLDEYGNPLPKDEDAEPEVTITQTAVEVSADDLPKLPRIINPQNLANRATAAGWDVAAMMSKSHKAAVLYVNDSEEDAKNPHRAGDVRYEAEDRTHYVLNAKRGPLAFRLYYTTRHKAKDQTAFLVGDVTDPVSGRMTVFEAATVKGFRDADLTSIMTPEDFADWFDTLVPPETARTKPKPRKTKTERTTERMLAGEEIEL